MARLLAEGKSRCGVVVVKQRALVLALFLLHCLSAAGLFGDAARLGKHLLADESLLTLCRGGGLLSHSGALELTLSCGCVVRSHEVVEHLKVDLHEFGRFQRACDRSLLAGLLLLVLGRRRCSRHRSRGHVGALRHDGNF